MKIDENRSKVMKSYENMMKFMSNRYEIDMKYDEIEACGRPGRMKSERSSLASAPQATSRFITSFSDSRPLACRSNLASRCRQ